MTKAASSPRTHPTALRVRLAGLAWTVGLVLLTAMYALGFLAVHDALGTVCETEPCSLRQVIRRSEAGEQVLNWPGPPIGYLEPLRPEQAKALAAAGLTIDQYGWLGALPIGIPALVCLLIAAGLFWRKPGDPMVLFASVMVATFPVGNMVLPFILMARQPSWEPLYAVANVATLSCLLIFPLIFPTGEFVPRWTRWVAGFDFAGALALAALRDAFQKDTFGGNFVVPYVLAGFGVGVYAQLYRYFKVANAVERQQLKWVIVGLAGYVSISVGILIPLSRLSASLAERADALQGLALSAIPNLLFLALTFAIPVSLAISVLRYRLWDIDFIFNRALVYGALTAVVLGLYVLMVGALGALFQAQGSPLLAIPATGLVALFFQPLRERVQRAVNRVMYGERDDPYAVLARLGERLEGALAPDVVLPTIAQTVKDALRLPYAAIGVKRGDEFVVGAAAGAPLENPLYLPMAYQGESVGQLILAPRAPGESFTPGDLRLLESLARQAGAAVHAARLTTDLQGARERLVATREEERRRLRRDLHDGLGANLASQGLKLAAAKQFLNTNAPLAGSLLEQVMAQNQTTVDDIRRLVYNLRPPALDELGLAAAVRDGVSGLYGNGTGASGLRVQIETTPAELPPLPAAVEVAAYRIAMEALTNVMRHARARRCTIRFVLDGAESGGPGALLRVEIADDGAGVPAAPRAGVGMISMRERAEELGGKLSVAPAPGGGTRVVATLPLAGSA